jgi:hypothetical protein
MISLGSTSREEDAALDALADLARAVADWDACRVVGGHMVAIHVSLGGADVQHRPTADADLAAPVAVLADPEFARRLNDLGYAMVDGSRLQRHTAHGEAYSISSRQRPQVVRCTTSLPDASGSTGFRASSTY